MEPLDPATPKATALDPLLGRIAAICNGLGVTSFAVLYYLAIPPSRNTWAERVI
jgi:hypothetical protein